MKTRSSCLSPHPARPQPGCRDLVWREPYVTGRIRVIEWTCECAAEVYELCEAAGLAFIRKTTGGAVWESDAWLVREIRRTWRALLGGYVK